MEVRRTRQLHRHANEPEGSTFKNKVHLPAYPVEVLAA